MAYSLLRGPLYVGGLVSLLATSLIDRVPIAHAQSAKIERLRSVLSEIEAYFNYEGEKEKVERKQDWGTFRLQPKTENCPKPVLHRDDVESIGQGMRLGELLNALKGNGS